MSYKWELFHEIEKKDLNLDLYKIKLAYELAKEAHKGQVRKSGEEYIVHPIEVSKILIDLKMDTDTVIAGILHDVVEDTLITKADIQYNFGENVAMLVDGVTKLKHLPEGKDKQVENIRKMIVAMAQDVRVVIIKLADRLHNMRTLKHMIPEKQIKIADETLKIFAPLAHRLGMAKIKWELEDLALYYLEPVKYRKIVELVNSKRAEREKYTAEIIYTMEEQMKKFNIKGEVTGRPKHFYSIYNKMYEHGKNFDEIYDLIAIRITTENEGECYNTLGVIHNVWKPVPGRFKDYIAVPKSNGYQSIHTTVVGAEGNFVELQIRTQEMHRIAEEGIAAHWKYKEKMKGSGKSDNVYSWLRKILEWQQEADDSQDFVNTVTGDLLGEEVFVFTPQGDVKEMPRGATPLDFAFHVHTEVGYKCIGAKVNNRIVPIDYKLNNGDRIEIITSKTAKGPGKDWMKIVVTHSAKSKIRKWFKDKQFEEKLKEGRILLEKEFELINIKSKDIEKTPEVVDFIKKHNIPNYNELLFYIGSGRYSPANLAGKAKKEEEIEIKIPEKLEIVRKKSKKKNDYGILINGVDNTVIRFAKCCTPMPGDPIGGYVSRGKGITVHRADCKNYTDLLRKDFERIIEVKWDNEPSQQNYYNFTFIVLVMDRQNILRELINLISENKINMLGVNSISFIENGEKRASVKFVIEIKEKEQYERLISSMKRIKEVIDIKRN